MKLKDFVAGLQKLIDDGHGDLPVVYRHGASGDCGDMGGGHVTDHTDECGPFDLDDWTKGQPYISVYVGS